jgi:hypothetical protein
MRIDRAARRRSFSAMSTLPVNAILRRRPDSIASEIDGEVVVMSIATGRTFGLDQRGSRIWALLEQPTTVDALVQALLRHYDTTADKCRADVVTFLETLAEKQLVSHEAPPA